MLDTFADGQHPPVLERINATKVPCQCTSNSTTLLCLLTIDLSVCDKADELEDFDEDIEVDNFDAMF